MRRAHPLHRFHRFRLYHSCHSCRLSLEFLEALSHLEALSLTGFLEFLEITVDPLHLEFLEDLSIMRDRLALSVLSVQLLHHSRGFTVLPVVLARLS